jgi:hypothetical protein
MKSQSPGRSSRRPRRGGGPRHRFDSREARTESKAPAKKSFWQKITALFGGADTTPAKAARSAAPRNGSTPTRNGSSLTRERDGERVRPSRRPESIEVTTPRLYVGNLSFDASESDLFELFNGVGQVQNAEVVTYKHNQRSKGFAFVQMQSVEEAKRAVTELHDKEFLGRKLVVSGAKSDTHARD